jgi:hypothetical protein
MSAKHRKYVKRSRGASRRRSPLVRGWGPGLTATALSAASISTALVSATSATVSAPPVHLAALITPANSTAQVFAGTTYYNIDWSQQYGPQQVVPFFLGPQGIVAAVDRNAADPNTVVLSSGWGAGQTGTALALMQANHDPAMNSLKLVVLDNDTNRAGGGFWTTYAPFAPLLLTSAAPTPNDTNVPVVDTAYEYNINSDAPTYPINLLADANSLIAYVYGYGAQSTAPMPAEALLPVPPGSQHYHYVVAPDGTVSQKIPVGGNITYVTFATDGLPLVRPLRSIPGGNILADAVEPTLTALVNWGYADNAPIPDDPGVLRPMGLLPPAPETLATAKQLQPNAISGIPVPSQNPSTSAATVQSQLTSTPEPVTEGVPSDGEATPKFLQRSNTVDMTGGNRVLPGGSANRGASSVGAGPMKQIFDTVGSALSGLTGGAPAGANAPSTTGSSGAVDAAGPTS